MALSLQNTLSQLRKEYRLAVLDEQSAHRDPLQQFLSWFDEAVKAQLMEPNAMVLSTVDQAGQPSSRMVLMKECTRDGLTFFTNYESKKGRELTANPRAALLFYWAELERQVRIEGTVRRVDREVSREYWRTRPRNSRIGSLSSPQSQRILGRTQLDEIVRRYDALHPGDEIPCPENWGGYLLAPSLFEFWQGRENRLHDRLEYLPSNANVWSIRRLAP